MNIRMKQTFRVRFSGKIISVNNLVFFTEQRLNKLSVNEYVEFCAFEERLKNST